MTIPANEIVSVTPNVLGAGGSALDLVGLLLTTSSRIPIGSASSFETAADVATYFGSSSDEAAAASIYFNGFDNSTVKPGSMLFAQYNEDDVAAYLRGGDISDMTLAELQALSGTLSVTMDGYTRLASSVNLSSATSFSSGATILETDLNAAAPEVADFTGSITGTTMTVTAVGSGTLAAGQTVEGSGVIVGTQIISQLSGAEGGIGTYQVSDSQSVSARALTGVATDLDVSYDSVSGAFIITSGVTGEASTAAFATGTLAASLKLTSATGAVISQGAAAADPVSFMDGIALVTQDWATFTTLFDPDETGNDNKLAFAEWTSDQNQRYGYVCWDADASGGETVPATSSLGYLISQAGLKGTCLLYAPDSDTAVFVLGIGDSIDFAKTNGRTTYAFRSQAGITATVTNATTAQNFLDNGYNFYGAYATANQQFTFLYNGSVSGDFRWMDSYINQIWLNNAFQLALMNLLVASPSIPYNNAGYTLIEAACADPINAGLNFGAFRAGVELSALQAAEVNAAAGVKISDTLQQRGWYLQVKAPTAQVRQARGTPNCTFWYMDGQSVQKIDLTSVDVL